MDPDAYDSKATERVGELRINVNTVVEQGLALCGEIGASAREGDDVEALSFIASMALRRHLRMLSADNNDQTSEDIIARCGAGLREACRMATAIDAAIAKESGLPRVTPDFGEQIGRALAVRAAYRRLLYAVEPDWDVTPLSVGPRIDTTLRAIQRLLVHPDCARIRARDRSALLACVSKLATFSTSGGIQNGITAWRDTAIVVEQLQSINLRAELYAHDLTACSAALDAIEAKQPAWPLAETLFGRSHVIDGLLARSNVSDAEWKEALSDLRESLRSSQNRT